MEDNHKDFLDLFNEEEVVKPGLFPYLDEKGNLLPEYVNKDSIFHTKKEIEN